MIGELKNPAVSIDLTRHEMGSVQGGAQRSSLGRSKRSGDHKGLGGRGEFLQSCRRSGIPEKETGDSWRSRRALFRMET